MANQQIPANLIDQIQILLREEAHLESFNPLDSSLPSPPTIEEALVSIDQFVDCLRCKHCKGALLRGSQSIICVYCGSYQQQEPPPQPIPYKSTLGFRCLLQSLGLGSSSSLKDEIALSDTLDLELKWSVESKRNSVKYEAKPPVKGCLNLVGVDFDSHVAEESSNPASRITSEQSMTPEISSNKETVKFQEQKIFASFENVQSYEAFPRSDDGEHDELSSWEAEFQSATQDTEHEHLQSSDNPTLDPGSNSGPPFHSKLSEGNTLVEDADVFASLGTPSSVAWSLEENRIADPSDDKKRVDDAEIEWAEFRTRAASENNQPESCKAEISGGLDISDDAWNDFTGSVGVEKRQPQTNIFTVPIDDSLSGWNNIGNESKAEDIKLGSRSIDQLNVPTERTQNNMCSQSDQIDIWSSHVSSVIQDNQLHEKASTVDDAGSSLDFWNDFNCTAIGSQQETQNNQANDKNHSSVGDITINAWNDIVSLDTIRKVQEISSAKMISSPKNFSQEDSFPPTIDDFGAWNSVTESAVVSNDNSMGNDHSSGAWGDLSILTDTHADQHQDSSTQSAENHTAFEVDGLFDSWSDFRSSGTQVFTKSNQDQMHSQKASDNQMTMTVGSVFNSLNDFEPSTTINKIQSQASGVDFFENKSNEVDHDFYEWSDIAKKSTNPPNNQSNGNGTTAQEDKSLNINEAYDSWSDFASSTNVGENSLVRKPGSAPDLGEAVKHDYPFNAWNVFVSSEGKAHNDNATMNELASERNLLDQNCSLQAGASVAPEVPDMFRMEYGDGKAECHADEMNQSEITTKITNPSSSDVETLISEMHDLSFMLESTLSVPSSK